MAHHLSPQTASLTPLHSLFMQSSHPPLPRTLVLDYHDSYTNNILTLFTQIYPDEEVQRKVTVLEVDSMSWTQCKSLLSHIDCIILSPGPGSPSIPSDILYGLELVRTTTKPILGICLGCQAIGVGWGGEMAFTPNIRHGQVISVRHDGGGVFDGMEIEGDMEGEVEVVVYNSLTLDESSLPDCLAIDAWSLETLPPTTTRSPQETPTRSIQGISHRTRPQWGVQFHPESISSTCGLQILSSFLSKVHSHYSFPASYPNLERSLAKGSVTAHAPSRAPSPPCGRGGIELVEARLGQRGISMETEDAFKALVRGRSALGGIWLDGQSPTAKTTTSMAMATFILSYNVTSRIISCDHSRSGSVTRISRTLAHGESFWDVLSTAQQTLQESLSVRATNGHAQPAVFRGGFVGWFGYEMKVESLAGYTASQGLNDEERVDACWAFCDRVIQREGSGEWVTRGVVVDEGDDDDDVVDETDGLLRWLRGNGVKIGTSRSQWEQWGKDVETELSAPSSSPPSPHSDMPIFTPDVSPETYMDGIEKCRDLIHSGNSYELTLTTTFRAHGLDTSLSTTTTTTKDSFDLYRRLRTRNPAPYSAYLHLPTVGTTILSSSPERFVRIDGKGRVEMKPIKGTRARVRCTCERGRCDGPGGESCEEWCRRKDEEEGRELQDDKKERAENLMIVDLIRSDLLSCCRPSSVLVPKLIALESYDKVHQLVTTVIGDLEDGIGSVEAVKRCFPPGSMTGAPKLRSVQILDGLESRARGVYAGALGYLSLDGCLDLSVVIRTIVIQNGEMTIGGGGAITWLSDPRSEWDEVMTKVGSVTR